MPATPEYGTFGFRFSESSSLAMCNLFAVGYDRIDSASYSWDGLTRTDGPLLLFQYSVDGAGYLEWEGRKERLPAGKAFMVEIPGRHRYWYDPAEHPWEFFFLLIRPTLILPNWLEAKSRIGTTPVLSQTSAPIRLMRNIYTEARAGRIADAYIASSYVYQFIAELGRFALSDQRDRAGWPDKIRLAANYIETNYARLVSLDELANSLHVSKYHLQRTFAETVGLTPHEYANRIRIERAMELLRRTESSIEEIAGLIGFSSGSYFIKVFAKLTGMTPGAFRHGEDNLLYSRLFLD
ncbi:helix-turn-helix transcriptional regulator [Cohnella panacarvi]|uniref:helix-turn-helix transcriptional regulator n=1 Tax=Cohnella panacarvi TaxID=400776 RepID=UPI00047EE3D0|nr:AraC family transcriptional regulator [Cohnella panacarvi]